MPDTSVKYFHSAMPGAPTLNGTAGSLIAVLDACLVNGFGLKTVDSIVVAGGVATATISTGHSLEASAVALIAGANSALNGEQKVSAVGTNTVKWTTSAADQTINSAGMTIKVAPANWIKQFSSANKAAYRSADPSGTQQFLQVIDSGAQSARVVGYEAMADVDTGTGVFPNPTQQAGGFFWSKSASADATARNWLIVADGRTFYFARGHSSNAALAYELSCFGDLVPTKSGDPFSALITGVTTDVSTGFAVTTTQLYHGASVVGAAYCSRSYTGYGAPAQMRRSFPTFGGSVDSYSGSSITPYPNAPDGGLYVVPWFLTESTGNLRGTLPGYWASPQNIPAGSFATRDSVVAAQGLPGKTLKVLVSTNPNFSVQATVFFDITGPWR